MAKILNNIIISLLVLFLVFCWMHYYTKSFAWSLATAIASAIVCCALIQMISKTPSKKQKKTAKKNSLAALSSFLTFNTDNQTLFADMFEKMDFEIAERSQNSLLLKKRELTLFVAFCFDFEGCSANKAVEFCKQALEKKCNTLCVMCNSLCKSTAFALKVAPNLRCEILEVDAIFALLEQQKAMPQLPQKVKKQPHIALSYALSRKRFKYYLVSAFFLVAVSWLSYFPLYNLVWATVLCVLAFYCMFNKRFNQVPSSAVELFK